MEIHQVRYFLAVCELLSFTRAARQCHVTQPSLTPRDQLLEKNSAVPVSTASARRGLTELGRIVQPYLHEHGSRRRAPSGRRGLCVESPTQLNLAIMCTIAPQL